MLLAPCIVAAQEARGDPIAMNAQAGEGGTVYGTISTVTGAPVGLARIDARGAAHTTFADSLGSYLLTRLPAGTITLQITKPGFDSLTVRVMAPRGGRVRVDVMLSQAVASAIPSERLPPVYVVRPAPVAAVVEDAPGLPTRKAGVWEWKGVVADAPETSGEPDVLRLLQGDPQQMMRPDGFGGTSVDAATGAIPDRVFVDGLPVWNSVHGEGAVSAINPDVVGELRVSDGASSARYGDALFETVDVKTRTAAFDKPSVGIGLGPSAARGWWASPVHIGDATGQLVIAGRRSSSGVLSDRSDFNSVADRWSDGLAVLSLRGRTSDVQLVAIGSGDRLAADVDDATVGAKTDAGSTAAQDMTLDMPWHSATAGAIWTKRISPSRNLVTKTWDAEFGASAASGQPGPMAAMSNRAREIGLASELSSGSFTMGASLERVNTSYNPAVQSGDSIQLPGGPTTRTESALVGRVPYDLRADPSIIAVYADRRWGNAHGRWSATSGIRATSITGATPFIEPRLSVSLDLGRGVVASAGYATTHQFVQSLRDVTSAAGVFVPVSFPLAAGSAGVPVAAAQTISASVSRSLSSGTSLLFSAYDRNFNGVISLAPREMALAGQSAFNILDGRTIGIGSSVQTKRGNVIARMTYGVQRTALSSNSTPWFPSRQLVQTAAAVAAWRMTTTTTLRISSSIGSSFPGTPGLADSDPSGIRTDLRNDTSQPGSRALGALVITPGGLPAYMRVDLGGVHEWHTADKGTIGLSITLANVFGRANVTTFSPEEYQTRQHVFALTPRSLLAGITWHR